MRTVILNKKDDNYASGSSTVGVVRSVAEYVFEQKHGVVYGAAYTEDFHGVEHIRITTIEEYAEKLAGSKYVQSKLNGVFKKIKEDLENGLFVCFIGTPCQNHALDLFIGKPCENLFKISLACNSVVPQNIFEKYIVGLENKYNSKVKKINMRDRTISWAKYGMRIDFENGMTYFSDMNNDYFLVNFSKHAWIPEKCDHCKMRLPYSADLIVGDYWNVCKTHPHMFNDKNGTGICSIITSKAENIFKSILNRYVVDDRNIEVDNPGFRMKTANICTWLSDNENNFGQKLQAFAVQRILKDRFAIYPKTYHYRNVMDFNKITSFQKKYMNLLNAAPSGNDTADYFIAGSDQIWNPLYEHEEYYLGFTNSQNKIAFAASIGDKCDTRLLNDRHVTSLKQFKHITLRERKSVEALSRIGIKSEFVLDPVFLVDKSILKNISKKPDFDVPGDFIFKYNVSEICTTDIVGENKTISNAIHTVEEFLWCVINAKIAITNSFHCIVLRTIFNKPVKYSGKYEDFVNNSRFDVINEMGFDCKKDIQDWKVINDNLTRLIKESYAVLDNIFKDESCIDGKDEKFMLSKQDFNDKVFVISVKYNRWILLNDVFKAAKVGFDIQRFHGVRYKRISDGKLNCEMSHCAAINMAKTLKLPYILVFEDDAYPRKDVSEKLDYYLSGIPKDADILALGLIGSLQNAGGNIVDDKYIRIKKITAGAHAYIVFEKAYDKILETQYNSGCSPHFDDTFYRYVSYVTKEPLFIQYNTEKSNHNQPGYTYTLDINRGGTINSVNPPDGFLPIENYITDPYERNFIISMENKETHQDSIRTAQNATSKAMCSNTIRNQIKSAIENWRPAGFVPLSRT